MSNKETKLEVEWEVVNELPNLEFDVQLPEDFWWQIVRAYLWGKMKLHYIKPILWDKVTVELCPYDMSKGRITFRKK